MLKYLKSKNHKTISVFILSFFFLLLTGCSMFSSILEYCEGTKCLERGDYRGAIVYLEKAVEIDPTYSKYQGNLACAYIGVGELEKAWYHSRKAVLGRGCGASEMITFINLHNKCVQEIGLEQKGTLLQDVLCILGEPDCRYVRDEGLLCLLYGRCIFVFIDEKLVESGIVILPEE